MMKTQTPPTLTTPTRVRIYTHLTQSRFLHVEDALGIGKLRLFAGNYRKGQGMQAYAHAFVDIADARVVFGALARGEPDFVYKEYKGTPPQNGKGAISRVLSVAVKGEKVYIELKSGPGKMTPTGAITPNGQPEVAVNVMFTGHEARRLAVEVLAYLRAWDVLRMMQWQQAVGRIRPYELVAAASEGGGNGRPVTRKELRPKIVPDAGKQKEDTAVANSQPLTYGDGTAVDMQNVTEVTVYRRYLTEKQSAPVSKTALLDFYRQQTQVIGG